MLSGLAVGSGYTYTVRFYSGQQGTFGGSEVVTYENLNYGDRVTFRQSSVTLKDGSKYYVKGIRESGKDNNTAAATSFVVTGDQDYVVAYGILGSAVAYTVQYQDANGTTLAEPETYYGNVGDKPVIAYLYIEGYQPQAYNLTKTLSEDASENLFTFVYTPVESRTYFVASTPVPTPTVSPALEEENQTDLTDQEETDGLLTENEEQPREIINLDDPDTPLANLELTGSPTAGADAKRLVGARLWPVAIAVAVLFLGAFFLVRKKKNQEEQEPKEHE
jgi:predicted nucleic acid-binding Zn ribbon protein